MKRPMPFRRISSPGERDMVKAELREAEMQLHSPDLIDVHGSAGEWAANDKVSAAHSGVATKRAALLKKQLDQEMESIDAMKKQNDDRIRDLEERVSAKRVPREQYYMARQDSKDYNKIVDHLVNVELGDPQHQRDTQELQNRLRARSALNSKRAGSREDPNCASLEHLRK